MIRASDMHGITDHAAQGHNGAERPSRQTPPGGANRRDQALLEDVCDVLRNHRQLDSRRLFVTVRGGVAHISGTVDSAEERRLIRRTVARVRGILAVWDVLPVDGEDQPRVLDIGCGRQKQHSWAIGVDCQPYEGVDVVTNLEDGLPFDDGVIDQVFAVHFLEHVQNLLGLMNEIHRVLKPGGVLHVMVPHHGFVNALADPTHVRFFHPQTFKFFCRPYPDLRVFRPLALSATADNILADLEPVQPAESLPSEQELARFFD